MGTEAYVLNSVNFSFFHLKLKLLPFQIGIQCTLFFTFSTVNFLVPLDIKSTAQGIQCYLLFYGVDHSGHDMLHSVLCFACIS